MRVIVESRILGRSLARVHSVVERRNTIPILSNVALYAAGDRLTLRATDLDLEITETLAADIAQPGEITVAAHLLSDIIKKLPEGAEVVLEVKDAHMSIKTGRSRFTLNTLPIADFPTLTVGEFPKAFDIPAKDLNSLIGHTQFAISTEETRYYLNGIYFHPVSIRNRTVLRCVSTDGHRLAQSQVTAPDGMENFSGIIIPKKTVAEMARLLDKVESSAHVEVSDTKIRLTVGDVILVSKLIDGTFPDYDRVIPKANDKKLTVSKADLRQTVDRVATIASERGRAVKLTCAADKMTVSCHSPDQGAATEDIAAQYQADAIEIGFNSRYLLDLAAHLGDGEVEFEFADPGSPTLLRSVGELDTLFVLMPMRV